MLEGSPYFLKHDDSTEDGLLTPLQSESNVKEKTTFSCDKFDKHLIRLFRKDVCEQFNKIHGMRRYRWKDKGALKKAKEYYTKVLGIESSFYDQYEPVFCQLLYQTREIGQNLSRHSQFLTVMRSTFGSTPNRTNKSAFFAHPAIRALWFWQFEGQTYQFLNSLAMLEVWNDLDYSQKIAVKKHFQKF